MSFQWRYVNGSTLGSIIPDAALHAVLGAGRVGDGTDYRALAIYNADPALTISTIRVWQSLGAGGGAVAIGLSPRGVRPGTDLELVGSSEPTGVAFSSPVTRASGLAIASLPPLHAAVVWVRRTLTSAAAASPELNRLHVAGTMPI